MSDGQDGDRRPPIAQRLTAEVIAELRLGGASVQEAVEYSLFADREAVFRLALKKARRLRSGFLAALCFSNKRSPTPAGAVLRAHAVPIDQNGLDLLQHLAAASVAARVFDALKGTQPNE